MRAGPGGSQEGCPCPSMSSNAGCPLAAKPGSSFYPLASGGAGTQGLEGMDWPCLAPWKASVGWREDHTAGPAGPGAPSLQELTGLLPLGLGVGVPRAVSPDPAPGGLPQGGLRYPTRWCLCSGAGGLSPSHSPGAPHSGDPALEILPGSELPLPEGTHCCSKLSRSGLCFNFGGRAWCLTNACSAAERWGAHGL